MKLNEAEQKSIIEEFKSMATEAHKAERDIEIAEKAQSEAMRSGNPRDLRRAQRDLDEANQIISRYTDLMAGFWNALHLIGYYIYEDGNGEIILGEIDR